jgi:FkbM family methyltransferase
MTEFELNKTKFKLSDRCKSWFSLPEKDVYEFIDGMDKNMIFYDLGACEGRFTVYSGVKNIKTYSFEPDCYNFAVLKENIEINNLEKNVSIFKIAISNVNKDLYLLKNQPFEGGHLKVLENGERVEDFKDCKEKELVKAVKAVKLDDFIEINKLPYPDYIKVDVDGNEINFIEGADKTLNYIKKIHIELTDANKEIIINLLSKYELKIEKKIDIYGRWNNKVEGLYNYIFSK